MKKRRKARPGQPPRKQRKPNVGNAFEPESCWVEWDGEMIWAVGFTEGDAPYGLTRNEYFEAMGLPLEGEVDDPGIFWSDRLGRWHSLVCAESGLHARKGGTGPCALLTW